MMARSGRNFIARKSDSRKEGIKQKTEKELQRKTKWKKKMEKLLFLMRNARFSTRQL